MAIIITSIMRHFCALIYFYIPALSLDLGCEGLTSYIVGAEDFMRRSLGRLDSRLRWLALLTFDFEYSAV